MSEGYDQDALDAASREVHMMLLREGSSWGTKACEEMGRVFMTSYRKALPSAIQDIPPREYVPAGTVWTRHSGAQEWWSHGMWTVRKDASDLWFLWYGEYLQTAMQFASAPPSVPPRAERAEAGSVTVPREPTEAMCKAGRDAATYGRGGLKIGSVYRAMLSAAPQSAPPEGVATLPIKRHADCIACAAGCIADYPHIDYACVGVCKHLEDSHTMNSGTQT